MTKKAAQKKAETVEKTETTVVGEKLLNELISSDSRLKAAWEQSRRATKGNTDIGEEAIKIYRQRLKE